MNLGIKSIPLASKDAFHLPVVVEIMNNPF